MHHEVVDGGRNEARVDRGVVRRGVAELEARIKANLPDEYQDRYEDVKPVSMGSARLKYGLDGKVAWDEIWGSFCDLAMAGGPPHKGALLEPGTPAEIAADAKSYTVKVGKGKTFEHKTRGEK